MYEERFMEAYGSLSCVGIGNKLISPKLKQQEDYSALHAEEKRLIHVTIYQFNFQIIFKGDERREE